MGFNNNGIYWVAEYSNKQDCFHLGRLKDILEKNIDNAINLNGSDYQILFIGTYEGCSEFIKKIRKIKKEKDGE